MKSISCNHIFTYCLHINCTDHTSRFITEVCVRKHGIEADSSKVSLSSFVLSESDKETVVTKTKEEKPSVMEEEYYPAYLGTIN